MAEGDIFRFSVVGTGEQEQELVCVFHYQQAEALILDSPGEDLCQAWQLATEDLFSACFGSACAIRQYQVRGVTDPTYGFDLVLTEPVAGGLGGEMWPPQDCSVIKWSTGLIGRSFRGRSYIWPATEGHQTSGRISSGLRANLQAFAASAVSMGEIGTTATWNMGVLSRFHNNTQRAEPVFTPVVEGIVRDFVFTQRRRHSLRGS
jgi:hypothetical protein